MNTDFTYHDLCYLYTSSEEFLEAIKVGQQLGTLELTVDGDVSQLIIMV